MDTLNRAKQLQDRTKKFAVRIIKAFAKLPKDEATRVIGRQFLRSGTSLAANYRAACRARSSADFISKISVVSEEAERNPLLAGAAYRFGTNHHQESRIADGRM